MSTLKLLNRATASAAPTQSAATGTITTVATASLVEGETFTISDGFKSVVFEFDSDGSYTSGNFPVYLSGVTTADQVRDACIEAINRSPCAVLALNGGAATVSLIAEHPGEKANVAMSDTVANGGFVVSGMSGANDNGWNNLGKSGWIGGIDVASRNKLQIAIWGDGASVTMKLWAFLRGSGDLGVINQWFPVGADATAANKGILNGGNAIDAITGTTIRHLEYVENLRGITGLHLEITAGSPTWVDALVIAA